MSRVTDPYYVDSGAGLGSPVWVIEDSKLDMGMGIHSLIGNLTFS